MCMGNMYSKYVQLQMQTRPYIATPLIHEQKNRYTHKYRDKQIKAHR